MSLCDSDMKRHIESSTLYAEVEDNLDSLRLLSMIKKLVYTRGTHDLHVSQQGYGSHEPIDTMTSSKTHKTSGTSTWQCEE